MKLVICSVRDNGIQEFGQPFCVVHVGGATRQFSDEVNNAARENNAWYAHPEDFDLYKLGVYDGSTGIFETHAPELIVRGKDVKRVVQ